MGCHWAASAWTPQMTADHYRSSNPNLSPNPNPNPNLNRSSAVICGVQADRLGQRLAYNGRGHIVSPSTELVIKKR